MLYLLYPNFSFSDGFHAYLDVSNLVTINYNEMQMLQPGASISSVLMIIVNLKNYLVAM